MDRIPSFSKNHDVLPVGLHENMQTNGVTTWDLRFKKPNGGDYITPKALHTTEHLLATALRNGENKQNIIYFGPMGCRTGYYLLTVNMDYGQVLRELIACCKVALSLEEIPGGKREECGNYLEHDLAAAKKDIENYLEVLLKL